jgi:NADH:ubiquinone oxidoreductase subunit 5 (subunit L)/multisubunit Na+/H+ antiporter MnhA subunit
VIAARPMDTRAEAPVGDARRLAGVLLIAAMAIGSLALWLVVPAASLYAASKLVGTSAEEYVVGLPMTIAAMVAFGTFLVWLNRTYLRITGVLARYEAELEEVGGAPPFLRGPLEPLLVTSLVVALAVLAVWFFGYAKNPPLVPL